jgi:PTS system mannose-specific IIA component
MIHIVVLTHGALGHELLKTCEMIIGKQDLIHVLTVQIGMSLNEITYQLDEIIENFSDDGILIFTDMFGGSPSNIAMSYLGNEHVEVLTGVNLPMLLKALSIRKDIDNVKEFAEIISQSGIESIILAGDILKK